jgi:low affinity Fe/Cu permease
VVVWAITGPFFHFSDTWQLVINTGTTIVTFLMVFLIQNSQNRDSAAIQVKLDELIRVSKASNAFMGLEHLTDEELEAVEGKNEGRAKAVLEPESQRGCETQAQADRRRRLGGVAYTQKYSKLKGEIFRRMRFGILRKDFFLER